MTDRQRGTRAAAIAMAVLALAGAHAPLRAQGTGERLRRSLDVVVTDKSGEYVTDLGVDDFEVYENGKHHAVAAVLQPAIGKQEVQFLALIFENVNYSVAGSKMARQAALEVLGRAAPNIRRRCSGPGRACA
jgi:hypothetical protein